jgi:hypothetical protein
MTARGADTLAAEARDQPALEWSARVGFGVYGVVYVVIAWLNTSRSVAFGIIGGLFVWAALTHDPHRSGGLDKALQRLRDAPFGTVLLVAIAVGFVCYGVYNVAKACYLRRR